MSDIVLSSAVRSNLLALQNTAKLMATTQDRLATGKKVNSALDNPTNYFTAASLDSRANDLNTLLDSVGNGVQALKAADTGITSLQKLVDSAKSTARQALQSSAAYTVKANVASSLTTSTSYSLLGLAQSQTGTVTGLTSASTLATGGSFAVNGTTVTYAANATVASVLTSLNAISGISAALDSNGSLAITSTNGDGVAITGANAGAGTDLGITNKAPNAFSGQALTVTVGTGSGAQATTLTFGQGAGKVSSLDELNTALNGIGAQASVDSAGKLNITTTNESGAEAIALTGGAAASFAAASATATLGGTGQTDRNNLVTDYNNLLGQIDKLAQDASFNGVNLLNGDNLTVIFNEKSTSKLTIQGVTFNSSGLGLATVSNSDFADSTSINVVLDKLSSATSTLRSQASKFGSNLSVVQTRQDFSKSLINVLQQGSANLTLADVNEEGANMTALQTRQSLSVTALSLATQAQQAVLRLF